MYNLTLKIGENSGLFGYVENATIMNTIVNGPQVASNPVSSLMGSIGAVCGEARASVIRNCHTQNANMDFTKNASYMNPSYVGGVCGSLRNESRMVGCSASGKVLSVKDYVGGIVGVISLAEIDSCTTLLGDSITSVYARSYAGGIAGGVFSRSIASSIHNCTVASGVEVLSNDVGLWATVCPIEQITDELNLYNGAYEIYTPKHLAAFRDKVNGGDIKINGRLMNNISMASFGAFGAIGKQSAGGYQGVFDGQNYTIDSLTIVDQAYAGLFAYLCKEGTVVKNLVLNAPSLNTVDNDYLGFLVGMATQKAAVDNCHVTGGNLLRTAKGTPECVGGIAGKADLGATVSHCSFQGVIQAMEKKVGGIVGELNSGAVISSCYIVGPSTVWGDDYVGGIVGEIIDDATTAVDCYANQAAGQITIHVTDGNTNSGLIWGKNGSKNAGTFTRYTEGGLIYEKTGKMDNDIESVMVTGVSDKSQSLHHVVYDIGTKYDYATDSIQNLQGAKNIDFIDCISNIAGTEASKWIHIGICDGALDSNFEAIYMRYTVYAGADHVMMLGPSDVYPVGDNMFVNCPNAKVYIDTDLYADFCAHPLWSKYKDHFVSTTSMRKDVDFTEDGVKYAYERNHDATGSIVEKKATKGNSSSKVQMVQVVACDNSKIQSNSGVLKVYQDIGETYKYNTTRILGGTFKNNENIKQVVFEEIMSDASNSYYDLGIAIGDSAFANCKNFETMYLVYWKTSGTNNSVGISPDSLRLGNGVFDGCPNLRIKIDYTQKEAFLADTCWNKYADKIVPCLLAPRDETVYNVLKDFAYTSPLANQATSHIDISTIKPWDVKGKFRFERNITSFDEFSAFELCGFDSLYNRMFELCSNMQSITIPNGVRKICDYVFFDCNRLTRITIPSSVRYLGNYVFKDSGIKEIFFESKTPPTLKQNDYYTFSTIISKEGAMVYVPDSSVEAYKEAYPNLARANKIKGKSAWRSLKVIKLSSGGELADSLGLKYNYVTGLTEDITLEGGYAQYDSLRIIGPLDGRDIGVLRFLGGRDVEYCNTTPGKLRYLDLYNTILYPGEYEYNRHYTNDKITAINTVDTYMFAKLDALETLILPRMATTIKDKAVYECPNLKTLVVGDNVESMGDNVIYNDISLQFVVMQGKKVPTTTSKTFINNGVPFKALLVPYGTQGDYMGNKAFYNGADTITHFLVDEWLQVVMLDHNVYTPDDLMAITDMKGWFSEYPGVKTFDELYYTNILALRDSTFLNMDILEQITLPANLLAITSGAFKNCPNLHTIWAIGNFIPALGANAFESINPDFVVYVSADQAEAYRKAWPQYASHIRAIGSSSTDNLIEITLTKPNTLADALGLKVTSEQGVFQKTTDDHHEGEKCRIIKGISGEYNQIKALKVNGPISGEDIAVLRLLGGRGPGDNMRVYLSQLEYLDLYDADIVKGDEDVVFTYLPKILGYINMEDGVEQYVKANNKIPRMTFRALDNIKTLILPRTAVELGYESCYDMYSLKKLVVGDDMTYIDNDALGECNNLKSIIMLSKAKPKLNDDAFTDPTFEGDVLKVDHFYVPEKLSAQYTSDTEYTQHANAISIAFDGDKTFYALGRHGIATIDDLAQQKTFKHLFQKHCQDVTDLSMLSHTQVDSVYVGDFSNMPSLQRLALPSTLTTVEADAFAGNKALHWLDMSTCDSIKAYNANLGVSSKAIVYVPKSTGESDLANVVYTDGSALKCAKYNLSAANDFDVPKAFTAQTVTFGGAFYPDSIATLTLPFSCRVPAGIRAYQFEDGYYNEIHFGQVDTIKVNQPYVIKIDDDYAGSFTVDTLTAIETTPVRLPQVDGAGYTSLGALSSTTAASAAGQNLLVMNGDARWNLVSATDTVGIRPFTSYLQAKNTEAPTKDVVTYFDDFYSPSVQLYEDMDNTDTINCYNQQRVDASLTRTLVAGAWNTFSVPFDFKVSKSALKDAVVMGVKEIQGNCISYKRVEYVKAGQAYLVKPAADIVNPTFSYVRMRAIYPQYAGGYDYIGLYSPMTIDITARYTSWVATVS